MVKTAELRDLGSAELAQQLHDAERELFNLRFQLATGRLDNVARIGTVRRQIARLLTLRHERELGIVREPKAETARRTRRRSGKEREIAAAAELRGRTSRRRSPAGTGEGEASDGAASDAAASEVLTNEVAAPIGEVAEPALATAAAGAPETETPHTAAPEAEVPEASTGDGAGADLDVAAAGSAGESLPGASGVDQDEDAAEADETEAGEDA